MSLSIPFHVTNVDASLLDGTPSTWKMTIDSSFYHLLTSPSTQSILIPIPNSLEFIEEILVENVTSKCIHPDRAYNRHGDPF